MINQCHTCKHKLKGCLMFKYLTTSALISCVISKTNSLGTAFSILSCQILIIFNVSFSVSGHRIRLALHLPELVLYSPYIFFFFLDIGG